MARKAGKTAKGALKRAKRSYKEIEEELARVKKYFYEEILRKDAIIADLKAQNMTLLATAIKQGKRLDELNGKIGQLEKKLYKKA